MDVLEILTFDKKILSSIKKPRECRNCNFIVENNNCHDKLLP